MAGFFWTMLQKCSWPGLSHGLVQPRCPNTNKQSYPVEHCQFAPGFLDFTLN